MSYDVKSNKAEDFINDEEILETLDYAEKHKTDEALIESILEEASHCNGLSHRKAAVLLACEVPSLNKKIEDQKYIIDFLNTSNTWYQCTLNN